MNVSYHSLYPVPPLFKTAEAIAVFSLDTPSKYPSPKKPLLDAKKRSVSLDSLVDNSDSEEDEFEVLRTKFVGDMDLPERKHFYTSHACRSFFV